MARRGAHRLPTALVTNGGMRPQWAQGRGEGIASLGAGSEWGGPSAAPEPLLPGDSVSGETARCHLLSMERTVDCMCIAFLAGNQVQKTTPAPELSGRLPEALGTNCTRGPSGFPHPYLHKSAFSRDSPGEKGGAREPVLWL